MTRYKSLVDRTRLAVEEAPGELASPVRRAIVNGETANVPVELLAYVDKVRGRAHAITDADVEVVKRAGYTEDQIFEATASAAVGAALHRLRLGMAAVRGVIS